MDLTSEIIDALMYIHHKKAFRYSRFDSKGEFFLHKVDSVGLCFMDRISGIIYLMPNQNQLCIFIEAEKCMSLSIHRKKYVHIFNDIINTLLM